MTTHNRLFAAFAGAAIGATLVTQLSSAVANADTAGMSQTKPATSAGAQSQIPDTGAMTAEGGPIQRGGTTHPGGADANPHPR